MVKNLIVITKVEENPTLTLEEIYRVYNVSAEFMKDVLDQGVVVPLEANDKTLHFSENNLKRIRTIARLHHDLDVNVSGGALIVEMMEEMEQMRQQLALFEKYFKI